MDFTCPDPKATVRAANVRATLDAFRLLPELGRRIVERHELSVDDLRPDAWILVQRWLDALKEIQGAVGPAKVREVGRLVVENADIPPIGTEALLLALDQVYYQNHRGDVGHYRTTRIDDGSIEVRCETPYPRHFEWGLIDGFCGPQCAGSSRYSVEYIEGPPGGDHTCTLTVRKLG
ncbi:MAG TPA: hypothetical protein VGP93_14030 [Polyangiaceae bacterium]|nr:hypothetical protein [Polyangiaceae bacterium]